MPNGNDDIKKDETGLPKPDPVFMEFIGKPKFGMSRTTPTPAPDESEQSEPAQQQAQTTQPKQPKTVDVVWADGTKVQEPLPETQQELEQAYANYKSLEKSYEALKGVVREKAPEIADDLRPLLRQQTEILNKMADAQVQAQTNQKVDPVTLLSEEQLPLYQRYMEQGDEAMANAYMKSSIDTNRRIFESYMQNEETKREIQKQAVVSRLQELRALDSSIPNPRLNLEKSVNEFEKGYGGYLLRAGFSAEQVMYSDNIDHETLYSAYQQSLTKTGQSRQNKSTQQETPVKTVDPAKAVIPPDVAKSIQDVGRGSVSANIGGEQDGSRYRNVHGRAALRRLANDDPSFVDNIMKGMGIDEFLPKRPKK